MEEKYTPLSQFPQLSDQALEQTQGGDFWDWLPPSKPGKKHYFMSDELKIGISRKP